jgi:hypothetical protein
VTSFRRKTLVLLMGAVVVVALVPSSSLASHDVVRARRVGPGDYRWRDSETGSSQTHLFSTPHRLKWRNPSNGVRHDVTFYRQPSGANVSNIGNLAPGETKARRISEPGFYRYRCTIHSGFDEQGDCRGMCGRIRAH